MHVRQEVGRDLGRVAEVRDGVVTRGELLADGVSRHAITRLLRDGWLSGAPGVYLTHPGPPTFLARSWVALLHAGGDARLGMEAAAHEHGWTTTPPRRLVVWTNRRRQPSPLPGVSFRRDSLGRPSATAAFELTSLVRPPCTDHPTTALDLCAQADVDQMVVWLARAGRSRADLVALRTALAKRRRQPRRALLGEMLAEVAAGAESPLERRFVADVLVAHALPVGRRQVQTAAGRVDLVDEEHGVVVELDGRLGHEREGAFRDARRDNATAAEGRVPLRYGWTDSTTNRCATARQVAGILRTRGWRGRGRECPACRGPELPRSGSW